MSTVNIFKTDLRNKVRVEVPFIKGAWVELYDDTTVDAVQKAQNAQTTKGIKDNLEVIANQIADWNFADNKGILPITVDSLSRFPMKLLNWLAKEQAKLFETSKDEDDQKKN